MSEIWKIVKKTKFRIYEVSDFGRRRIIHSKTKKILKIDYGIGYKNNYLGFSRLGLAHRVIAIAFIPNPENKPQVNHIDGNKSNNHISNLEWCTASENTKHAYDIGLNKGILGQHLKEETKQKLREANLGKKASDETKAKLSKVMTGKNVKPDLLYFKNISGLTEFCTMYELKNKYNLSATHLSGVCSGKRKSVSGWSLVV